METPQNITQQHIIDDLVGFMTELTQVERSAVLIHVKGMVNGDSVSQEAPLVFEQAMRTQVAKLARQAIDQVVVPMANGDNSAARRVSRLKFRLQHTFPTMLSVDSS